MGSNQKLDINNGSGPGGPVRMNGLPSRNLAATTAKMKPLIQRKQSKGTVKAKVIPKQPVTSSRPQNNGKSITVVENRVQPSRRPSSAVVSHDEPCVASSGVEAENDNGREDLRIRSMAFLFRDLIKSISLLYGGGGVQEYYVRKFGNEVDRWSCDNLPWFSFGLYKMSRRYGSCTTVFSPEGRLYQVEYAMEAIGNARSAIGILSTDGVVLVGEKKVTSKLLQTSASTEKMYKIDDHVACDVAGIISDANILINTARVQA
ncbi:unnamed protein product [Fraxinus pennsylvanica]|uniref:Proteasome subunit alpha type n=1 Tax=Fraxinus pennsylvanica TaxID=56036 RepID=A0AAD2E5C8_9LAMI|nr:unnamed protein product [Fraxinus pennsylvanica]